MKKSKGLIIGCGNLGATLLHAWAKHHALATIVVVQPSLSREAQFASSKFITFVPSVEAIPDDFSPDIIVLAFKPHHLNTVIADYHPYIHRHTLIISLLAGTPLERLAKHCPSTETLVRVMPNLAMKVGESVNLIFAPHHLPNIKCQTINQLFSLTGEVIWLESEKRLDQLTTLSSSGLAYFFLLAQLMTQAAIKLGLPPDKAKAVIRQTLLGSASLATAFPELDFEQWVTQVASKKGVTEAALNRLQPELTTLFDQALTASLERVEQLSQ